MRIIALYDITPYRHKPVAGIIMTPYVYTDGDVEACLKSHLEQVYKAHDIRYNRTTGIVYFTFGGSCLVNSSFKVQVMQKDSVTIHEREPLRMSTTGEIINDH